MSIKHHQALSFLHLLLLSIQCVSIFSFIPEDQNEISNHFTSFETKTLENSLGLRLDEFEPGKQFDINGVSFTVNEDSMEVKPDQGLNSVKFGIETLGSEAAIFGGFSPVGIIDTLPANEKITITAQNNVVDIELTNNEDTSSVNVKLNGEDILTKNNEEQLVVLVDIDEEEETLKVSYQDAQGSVKIVQDLETGERSSGETESEEFVYEVDEMSHYKRTADAINKKQEAVIKKLNANELRDLKNAKKVQTQAQSVESVVIDIIVIEREVFLFQGDETVGAFVLEKQEILEFEDTDGQNIDVVLTPEGIMGVRADVLVGSETVQSKEAKFQLEIVIEVTGKGAQVVIVGDEMKQKGLKQKKKLLKKHRTSSQDF